MLARKQIFPILILLLLCVGSITAVAQSQNPVILTNDQDHYPLGPHLEILEDKEGTWTIEDVTSPEISAQFIPNQEDAPGYGFTDSAYWVRFKVKNEASAARNWLIELGTDMFYIDYYYPADNELGYQTVSTGSARPFSTRDIPSGHYLFRLPISPQETETVYMRFQSKGTVILSLSIWSDLAYFQQERTDLIRNSFFYGILFILAIYNLVIFFYLRDYSYLYYFLFFGTIVLTFGAS